MRENETAKIRLYQQQMRVHRMKQKDRLDHKKTSINTKRDILKAVNRRQ